MTILGVDTSAGTCTAAIMKDNSVLSCFARRDGLTHSETLLPGILQLLNDAGLSLTDLDGIAVSVGPGSFTGLRIGISTVKGLCYPKDLPCVPVSTLEALAENAANLKINTVCAVMDARRGEYYNALFFAENEKAVRLTEDRAVTGALLSENICDKKKLIIVGDGAEKFVREHPDFAPNLAPEEMRYQSAVSVCRVATRHFHEMKISCRALAPRYLRLPQAEREWLARNNGKI